MNCRRLVATHRTSVRTAAIDGLLSPVGYRQWWIYTLWIFKVVCGSRPLELLECAPVPLPRCSSWPCCCHCLGVPAVTRWALPGCPLATGSSPSGGTPPPTQVGGRHGPRGVGALMVVEACPWLASQHTIGVAWRGGRCLLSGQGLHACIYGRSRAVLPVPAQPRHRQSPGLRHHGGAQVLVSEGGRRTSLVPGGGGEGGG